MTWIRRVGRDIAVALGGALALAALVAPGSPAPAGTALQLTAAAGVALSTAVALSIEVVA